MFYVHFLESRREGDAYADHWIQPYDEKKLLSSWNDRRGDHFHWIAQSENRERTRKWFQQFPEFRPVLGLWSGILAFKFQIGVDFVHVQPLQFVPGFFVQDVAEPGPSPQEYLNQNFPIGTAQFFFLLLTTCIRIPKANRLLELLLSIVWIKGH